MLRERKARHEAYIIQVTFENANAVHVSIHKDMKYKNGW